MLKSWGGTTISVPANLSEHCSALNRFILHQFLLTKVGTMIIIQRQLMQNLAPTEQPENICNVSVTQSERLSFWTLLLLLTSFSQVTTTQSSNLANWLTWKFIDLTLWKRHPTLWMRTNFCVRKEDYSIEGKWFHRLFL